MNPKTEQQPHALPGTGSNRQVGSPAVEGGIAGSTTLHKGTETGVHDLIGVWHARGNTVKRRVGRAY